MPNRRKYTRELLEPLVAQSTSVSEVMRRLGLRANGGAHTHVSRAIKAHGIDTRHFVSHSPGRRRFRLNAEQILVVRDAGAPRAKPKMLKRALLEIGVPYRCASCGNPGVWCGKPLTLEIDHIDGDFYNNRRENLRFLCPNCHRLTPNHAGRSRGRFTAPRLTEG